jgi:hypothetical protein
LKKTKTLSTTYSRSKKQERWDYLDNLVHPSKKKGHIVTQEEWERRQKEAKAEQKQNPLLYYSNKIHGWVPDDEKSIEDMQEDYDANARIRGERLEKHRDRMYLWSLLARQKKRKLKITHADFLEENQKRRAEQEKKVDDTETWKREVDKEFDKKLVAERNTKYGKAEDFKSKTQWMKHIRSKIKALDDEIKEHVPERIPKGFVPQRSPQDMYITMISQVECECTVDGICDTCKLFNGL